MIGERDNIYQDSDYGTLHMRHYDISGNNINAFYDSSDNLVFVLDNTINANKPNVLLVINPDADRKWDEILANDYDVDLETIRPKQDNKYQKLDIEYSGLNVYEKLINAYNSGESLDTELNQLNVLRDSAARHSAMVRLSVANEIISKTNATIIKTKESIIRLQERVKTLRAKLTAAKKGIGRVPTKQSASMVLKLESQIDATNEKLKRAKKRLESAQKRLEMATVDAELASELLNQPSTEINQPVKRTTKNKTVMIETKPEIQKIEPESDNKEYNDIYDAVYDSGEDDEVMDNNDVKPLFNNDPNILNENIAFKPVSFETPGVPELSHQEIAVPEIAESDDADIVKEEPQDDKEEQPLPELPQPDQPSEIPYLNDVFVAPEISDEKQQKSEPEITEPEAKDEKPVLESLAPISSVPELSSEFESVINVPEEQPSVLESMTPVDERQYEPVVTKETEVITESEPVKNVATDKYFVPPMTESMHDEIMGESNKQKTKLVYYTLLIVLIALSVFTLWLYQKNVENTSPMLTADVEKTTVLKKSDKPKKAVKNVAVVETEIDTESVFLDESSQTPGNNMPVVESIKDAESEPTNIDNVVLEPVEPAVMDAVPARVNSSGAMEEPERHIVSEEEVLANKPAYDAGAKHEEMFVVKNPDDTDVDMKYYDDSVMSESEMSTDVNSDDVMYMDENESYIDENSPFYDAEEAQYQAEQNELYYEE